MNNLCIFAGGLGSRLRGTETKPKPLLAIGSSTLIALVIEDFAKVGFFDTFTILTCIDGSYYQELISKDLTSLSVNILVEPVRSGRLGAVKYFFDHTSCDFSYFCNADTLFDSLSSFEPAENHYQLVRQPVVYLADPDADRDDYKSVLVPQSTTPYQNSGLFAIHKEWFTANLCSCTGTDIDNILLCANPLGHILLNTSIVDIGTPERLRDLRGTFA